ncbi:MAG: histidine phosphatase family protein [Thermaerobacter sp.]|nr:histidine phosphatase family protein [Thermaerobacter sp.]
MRELYVVRHGESVANVERRFDSTPPGVPLTARGVDQANRVAEWLLSRRLSPKTVYASPFRRTLETAVPFADRIGARLLTYDELREVAVGAWDGRSSLTLADDPHYLRWRLEPEVAPPGGESLEDVWVRVHEVLAALYAAAPLEEPLILFTHQHTLRALLWHLSALRDQEGRLSPLPNAAILHLQGTPDALRLVSLDRSIDEATGDSRRAAI